MNDRERAEKLFKSLSTPFDETQWPSDGDRDISKIEQALKEVREEANKRCAEYMSLGKYGYNRGIEQAARRMEGFYVENETALDYKVVCDHDDGFMCECRAKKAAEEIRKLK